MVRYKIEYKSGKTIIAEAPTAREIIRKYELCTKENISTKVTELENNN